MDRTAWTAVILSIVGLVSWELYLTSKQRAYLLAHPPAAVSSNNPAADSSPAANPANPLPTEAAAGAASPAITSGKPVEVVDRQAAVPPAVKAEETAPEQIEKVIVPDILELHYTNLGGGIAEAIPLGPKHKAEGGVNITLNHAGHIPIGAISAQASQGSNLPYAMHREGDTVVFERTEPDGLKIEKRYSLDNQGSAKNIPAIKLDVKFTNTGEQPYKSDYFVHAGSSAPIHRRDLPYSISWDFLSDGRYHTDHVTSFDAGHIPLIGTETHPARQVITQSVDKAAWVAVKNQFYTTVVAPLNDKPDQGEPAAREIWARRFELPLTPEETAQNQPALHGLDAALEMPALNLAPGASKTQSFQIYSGPKFYNRLAKLGHDEQEVMDFGKFKLVSITLLGMMNLFKSWLHSYGLAIILLTFLVKAVLWPLQQKANKSMKRMSALSPKMTELREKYKEDPARLNKETMALYKEYGVSPVGGCVPMLVQMPIFFGFLYMLGTAAELRNSSFLWVRDLSQPDTLAHVFGYSINVLPLLMIGTQFWQMSLTPKTGDPQQQKMFMFMPLVFGFFCYNFAAALALYYTMQGLLTIVQLYYNRTQPAPTITKVAAVPVAKRGGLSTTGDKKSGRNGRGGGGSGNTRVRI